MIEDFKRGAIWSSSRQRLGHDRQNKGFAAQFAHIADVIRSDAESPDPESFFLSTLTTLAAARSLMTGVSESVLIKRATADSTPLPMGSG